MSIGLADLTDRATPVRLPGDFQRHPTTGAPYVSHPTETTAKGVPRRVMYGRPSGFGGALDNPYNLVKWKERELIRGLAIDPPDWSQVDRDREQISRETLDAIANRAYQSAGSSLAADRGTHVHLLCEFADKGGDSADLIRRGAELGIASGLQQSIVVQWIAFRARLGVTALAVEATVVHDGWQLAGTLDRLDQTSKPIDTTLGRIPKGKAFIGDIKTGSLMTDNNGSPRYWVKYPVQLAAYADAVPYDTDTDQRGVWEIPPHRKIALIYHYDLARALDGELVDWQAIPVDLNAGRAGGAAVLAAKQFRPVFGDPIALAPAPSTVTPSEVPCSISTSTEPTITTPEPTTTTAPPTTTSNNLMVDGDVSTTATPTTSPALASGSISATVGGSDPTDPSLILATQMLEWPTSIRERLARMWPLECPTPGSVRRGDTTWTLEHLTAIRMLFAQVDAPWDTEPTTGDNRWIETKPATSSPTSTATSDSSTGPSTTSTTQPNSCSAQPKNSEPSSPSSATTPPPVDLSGGPLDPAALDALLAACTEDDTRMIINAWLAESRNHNCYWNPRIVGTVRSFEQARAARALATMVEPCDEDCANEHYYQMVRLILTHTGVAGLSGTDMFPTDPIGVAIGHLTIAEAQAVCDTVDAINTEQLTLRYTDDGTPQLVA